MEQGVVWTSRRGCTVSGGLVGGGFWDVYFAPHGAGVGPEAGGGFLPAHSPGPRREEMTEDIAAGVLALRPRDGLDLDAASGTIDPPHGVGERDGDVPDGDELELPGQGYAVVSGAMLAASGASRFAVGPGDDFGDDAHRIPRATQADGVINEALDAADFVE